MTVLPRISGREVVAALVKLGYEKDRQKGSCWKSKRVIKHLKTWKRAQLFKLC